MLLKIIKSTTDLPGIWALVVVSYADLLPFVAGTLAIILSIIRIGQAMGWWRRIKR